MVTKAVSQVRPKVKSTLHRKWVYEAPVFVSVIKLNIHVCLCGKQYYSLNHHDSMSREMKREASIRPTPQLYLKKYRQFSTI